MNFFVYFPLKSPGCFVKLLDVFFHDLWFIQMKLLDVSAKTGRQWEEIVLNQVKRGAQGFNQADSIISQVTDNISILFLMYDITHDFRIALIVMPTTVVKCNLSSLEHA